MNLLSIGFAICVPLSCVYMISGKRSSNKVMGPLIATSTFTTSVFGAMLWVTGSNQRVFLKSLEIKYFSSMSDQDLCDFQLYGDAGK
jgi:predicted membrane protein